MLCVLTLVVAALGPCLPSARADDIAYMYDELGRVVQASNAASGEAVLYTYDAVGNITSQRTVALATLSIGHFMPAQGPIGTQVTINGTGFSVVPASNTVRFNGVTAAVVSATSTQIVATVPAGATTGTISVEVAATTATSSAVFSVSAGSDEPIITLVTPNMGYAGTAITLVGNNFETVPSRNNVRLNTTPALVTASSTMTLSAVIPAGAGSGKIRVTTPHGTAVSPSDFTIVPPNYGWQQIVSTGRMETDGTPAAITFPSSYKISLQLFEGKAGDLLTVGVTSTTLASVGIQVFAPDATQLTAGTVTGAGQGVQLPKLTQTGTYTVVVSAGSATGSVSIGIFKPLTDTVTVGGASSTVNVTPPGRRGLISFSGTQGDYANVTLSAVTLSAGRVAIISPTGAEIMSSAFTTTGALLQPKLPRTGTYVVLIDPAGSIGGSVTVTVAGTVSPSLAPNTGPVTVNLPNSSAVMHTFRGEAGEYMSVAAFVQATSSFGASVTVRNPDGLLLATKTPTTTYTVGPNWRGSRVVNFGPLQYSGTYSIVVQRTGSVTGSAELTLTSASSGTLVSNGTTVDVPITLAGQSVVRSFAASAGEFLSFAVGERTGFITGATITVLYPDGSVQTSSTFAPPLGDGGVFGGPSNAYRDGGKVINLGPMPVTGTYQVVLQQFDSQRQEDNYTGTLKLTLANPLTGSVVVDGSSANIDINAVGQGLQYTFEGTAGQYLALGMSSDAGTITAADAVVFDPSGVAIASGGMIVTTTGSGLIVVFGSGVVNVGPLAASGTYTVLVQQTGSKALSTGSIDLTLSTPLAVSIGTSGTASNVDIDRPGQGVMYTFSGTAGEYLAFHVSVHGWITAGSMTVLTASGASVANGALPTTAYSMLGGGGIGGYDGKAALSFGPLPTTATYSILFKQTGAGSPNTGPLTARLSTPLSGPLPPNSSTSNIGITIPGQGTLYTFSASAGDYRALVISESGGLIKSAGVNVLNPQGAAVATGALSTTAAGSAPNVTYSGRMLLNMGPLATSGTYTVLVQQTGNGAGETGTLALTFSEPATGTLTAGTPAAVPVSWPGQGILYSFAGTDGQLLSLQVSEAIGSYISDATVKILNPGSSPLKSGTLAASVCPSCGTSYTGSTTLISGPLPGAGTYRVLAQQTTLNSTNASVGTGELTLALTNLTPNSGSSTTISTTTPGQRAVVNFTASAGESIGVAMTSAALTPASPTNYTLYLYLPNGSQLDAVGCSTASSGCQLTARNLPVTGTYRVEIGAGAAQTISGTLTLSSALAAALTAATPYNLNLSTVGQPASLSFIAAAGETFSLNFASLSTTPASITTYATVFNAAGAVQYGTTAIGAGSTFNLRDLPAGNYSVWITSEYPATSSMQITLQPRLGGALVDGVGASFSAPARGQYAYFDFSATAGESISVALSNVTSTPNSPSYYMFYVLQPNGAALDWGNCTAPGNCMQVYRKLPLSGTYRVEVRPNSYNALSGTLTVSRAVTGALGTGVPFNLAMSALGQPAALTFEAAAGETFALNIASLMTTPANAPVSVNLFNAAGDQLPGGGPITASGMTMNLIDLPAGTYTAWIYPQAPATSSMQLTLHARSGGHIEEGVATSFSTPARGQSAYFDISATAGESLGVALTNTVLTPSPPGNHYLYVFQPSGAQLTWANCSTSSPGCEVTYRNLPQSGTYRIEVRPHYYSAISGTLTVTKAVPQSISLGVPLNLSLSPVGRPALLTFSALPGQTFALHVAGTSTVPVNTPMTMTLFDPTGAQYGNSASLSASATTINLPYLPTGAYSVWIVPLYPATSTLQVTLHPGTGGLLQDGVPANFSASVPSQVAYFQFAATAGDSLGLALNNVTFQPNTNTNHNLWLMQPNGALLSWNNCAVANGCEVISRSLPVTGTYLIEARPQGANAISGTLTVSKGFTATLNAGVPLSLSLTPPGRPALLTFTLASAQTVSMAFSSISTIPVGTTMFADIFNASGASMASGSSTTAFTLNAGALAAGTYTVWIYPQYPVTGSVTVSF